MATSNGNSILVHQARAGRLRNAGHPNEHRPLESEPDLDNENGDLCGFGFSVVFGGGDGDGDDYGYGDCENGACNTRQSLPVAIVVVVVVSADSLNQQQPHWLSWGFLSAVDSENRLELHRPPSAGAHVGPSMVACGNHATLSDGSPNVLSGLGWHNPRGLWGPSSSSSS